MPVFDIMMVTVAAALAACLCFRVVRGRLANRWRKQAATDPGHALDIAPLHQRLEGVRRDFGAAAELADAISSAARF